MASFSNEFLQRLKDSVNILDDKTVQVVLKEADTEFLAYMTTAIIPALSVLYCISGINTLHPVSV